MVDTVMKRDKITKLVNRLLYECTLTSQSTAVRTIN